MSAHLVIEKLGKAKINFSKASLSGSRLEIYLKSFSVGVAGFGNYAKEFFFFLVVVVAVISAFSTGDCPRLPALGDIIDNNVHT